MAKPIEIKQLLQLSIQNKFLESKTVLFEIMTKYGISGIDVIKQIQKEIWNLEIEPRKKVRLIDKCGEIEFRLVEGSDQYIQLEALLAHMASENNE